MTLHVIKFFIIIADGSDNSHQFKLLTSYPSFPSPLSTAKRDSYTNACFSSLVCMEVIDIIVFFDLK